MNTGILSRPLDVGLLRRCPGCERAFALHLVSTEKRGEVRVERYTCRYCKREAEFGDRHPRRAI